MKKRCLAWATWLLLLSMMLACLSNVPVTETSQRTEVYNVDAGEGWLDTGLQIKKNDSIAISTNGVIDLGGLTSGPGGIADVITTDNGIQAPYGALLGQIGPDGDPFIIGNLCLDTTTNNGTLRLIVNDRAGEFGDNSGQFRVTVTITRR